MSFCVLIVCINQVSPGVNSGRVRTCHHTRESQLLVSSALAFLGGTDRYMLDVSVLLLAVCPCDDVYHGCAAGLQASAFEHFGALETWQLLLQPLCTYGRADA
jgi:hypothetical protein